MRSFLILALAVLMAASGPVYGGPKESAARAAYEKGTTAYNLAHYDEAAQHYEAAYKMVRDPNMLFNIAQCYRMADKPEQALPLLRSFLREAPADAPNRPLAERFVEELKRKLEENKAAKAVAEGKPAVESAPAPLPVPAPAPAKQTPTPVMVVPAPAPAPQPQLLAVPVPQPNHAPTVAPAADLLSQPSPPAPDSAAAGQPFYKTWWFWTAAGAAVVAGSVTAFLLTRRAPDACGGYDMTCVGVK
jgi:tetratricopeptide (TPR) repeat protein